MIGNFFSDIAQILAEKDVKKIFSLTCFRHFLRLSLLNSAEKINRKKNGQHKKSPRNNLKKLTFTGALFPFHPFILTRISHSNNNNFRQKITTIARPQSHGCCCRRQNHTKTRGLRYFHRCGFKNDFASEF